MVIRIRRSTKVDYTSSSFDDESLICCCHHTVMIVVVDDINKFLSSELELKIYSADTWMTTQSCLVGDMVMNSYLYDRMILTYVD